MKIDTSYTMLIYTKGTFFERVFSSNPKLCSKEKMPPQQLLKRKYSSSYLNVSIENTFIALETIHCCLLLSFLCSIFIKRKYQGIFSSICCLGNSMQYFTVDFLQKVLRSFFIFTGNMLTRCCLQNFLYLSVEPTK